MLYALNVAKLLPFRDLEILDFHNPSRSKNVTKNIKIPISSMVLRPFTQVAATSSLFLGPPTMPRPTSRGNENSRYLPPTPESNLELVSTLHISTSLITFKNLYSKVDFGVKDERQNVSKIWPKLVFRPLRKQILSKITFFANFKGQKLTRI